MSTMGPKSVWLSDPDDDALISKSIGRGLGSIIAGSPLVQKLAKAAERIVVCKSGHESTVAKVESVVKCRCGAPWAVVKGEALEDEDETMAVRVGTTKSDRIPTGGSLDGQPLTTSKSKIRRPWVGTR